jgi:DUF438 domain-containing protein
VSRPATKERSQVLADHIELLISLLHHHHRGEDKHLWPKLLDRGPGEVAAIVDLMEDQHKRLERLIAEIHAAIRIWRRSAASESGKALADALDQVNPLLNEHMGMEEERILPIVEKYVTSAEWSLMVQEGAAEAPQESASLLFGMFMYESDPDVIQEVLSQMPPEARPVMKERASQAFASHSERVHGTATPPRGKM